MILKIGGFLENSLVNGYGIRSVIFVSGCKHSCNNCQNEFMQDFNYGEDVSIDDIIMRVKGNMPIIKGVTFSGGEPFENARTLSELAESVKALGLSVWCYSGYTYEEIINSGDNYKLKLLKGTDVLIDGKFDEAKTEGAIKYTGSSNQRIIDVSKSILENKVVVWCK